MKKETRKKKNANMYLCVNDLAAKYLELATLMGSTIVKV